MNLDAHAKCLKHELTRHKLIPFEQPKKLYQEEYLTNKFESIFIVISSLMSPKIQTC